MGLVQPQDGEHFVEIGPGRGRLTEALLLHPVTITAIEIDADCCEHLRSLGYGARLDIINLDILAADGLPAWPAAPVRVVGNLPYNVSSPILRWTARRRDAIVDAHYMLQQEVAVRIAAEPGGRAYGLLSTIVQWEFSVRLLKRLSGGAFRPPPRVGSAFVSLTPRPRPAGTAMSRHELSILQAAFGHRRKKLVTALAIAGWGRESVVHACEQADVNPSDRAERLSPGDYSRLAGALPARSQ